MRKKLFYKEFEAEDHQLFYEEGGAKVLLLFYKEKTSCSAMKEKKVFLD